MEWFCKVPSCSLIAVKEGVYGAVNDYFLVIGTQGHIVTKQ